MCVCSPATLAIFNAMLALCMWGVLLAWLTNEGARLQSGEARDVNFAITIPLMMVAVVLMVGSASLIRQSSSDFICPIQRIASA